MAKSMTKSFKTSKELLERRNDALERANASRFEYERLVKEGLDLYAKATEFFREADSRYETTYDMLDACRRSIDDEFDDFLGKNEDKLSRKRYVELEEEFEEYGRPFEYRDAELPSEEFSVEDAVDCFDNLIEEFESLPI